MPPPRHPPAGACVAPHVSVLRAAGFWRASLAAPPARRRLHALYCVLALVACGLYLAQECVYAYRERADMEKLSRVMFLLLCHVTSITKQLVFRWRAARVDELVAALHEPLLNPAAAMARARLHAVAVAARRLQRGYSGCAVATCVLWLVFPAARRLRSLPVEFAFWLPAPPEDLPAFLAVLGYSFYVTTLVGIANTTMDAFIGTVLHQCTAQLGIVRTNVEALVETSRGISAATGEQFQTVLMRSFLECLRHYDKICDISNELQDIFGTVILIQFTIGGWILCMAAYKSVSLQVFSVEFASMILFIICILTELFLYCYYGNELTYESARLLDSLYACGWERAGAGAGRVFPRALQLAGERARRPLRVTAAGLVPLSLETFLKILKSSYTFYAVLRQTK